VSFDVGRGTTLGLVGESGCGKTTLGRAILRLIEPTGGEVHFSGVDVLAASSAVLRRLRRDMQIVFQDPLGSLNPRMTVGQSIAEPLLIHHAIAGRQRRAMVAKLMDRVGLQPAYMDRYPHEFSGGQRQRVGIARAIALEPKFIVCDEPVSALDVSVQSQILNLLSDLQEELGLTYLFIAHNLAVVEHFADRVAVMYLGKIVEIGDAADLYDRPQHPYSIALLAAAPQPDPTRRGDRVVLAGDVPSPADPPTGCAFHPRCAFATEECRKVTPLLRDQPGLAPDHRAACHHLSETAGDAPAIGGRSHVATETG
jgi:oligopeptide/dipeptide ABC transporter ATP-binding protein